MKDKKHLIGKSFGTTRQVVALKDSMEIVFRIILEVLGIRKENSLQWKYFYSNIFQRGLKKKQPWTLSVKLQNRQIG
jgi:hypothetical protein